jgi:hypothetical protein
MYCMYSHSSWLFDRLLHVLDLPLERKVVWRMHRDVGSGVTASLVQLLIQHLEQPSTILVLCYTDGCSWLALTSFLKLKYVGQCVTGVV